MTVTRPPRRTPIALGALAALLLVAILAAGCSGSGDVSPSSTEGAANGSLGAPERGDLALEGGDAFATGTMDMATLDGGASYGKAPSTKAAKVAAAQRSVIAKGNISLRSDDVARGRFDVQKVVDEYAGEISDEQTTTDEDGKIDTSRMVLRIPSSEFSKTMDALEGVGELESSKRSAEDVTTQVIDIDVRIKVQRASIDRIQLLLAQARTIRDIVAIESQLTQRQAELNSLEQQQAYLADQTSLSTITVHIERTSEKASKTEPKDDDGFIAGLTSGWHGLTTFTTAVATLVGVVLPFTVVLLVLGALGWPVLRRLRIRRPVTTSPAPAES